jgi:PHP family Zn ribbon phosphoesterase
VTDQALPLEIGQHCQRRFDRPFGWAVHVEHDPEIDDIKHIEAEIAEIVVHCRGQLFTREGRHP